MGTLLGIAGLALLACILVAKWIRHFAERLSGPTSTPLESAPYLEGDGTFSFDIVGEASYQHALDRIAGGKCEAGHEIERLATLEREPDNRHDANAIAVLIEGLKVGYIPRTDAAMLAEIMDRNDCIQAFADAVIVGGWKRANGEGHYGVCLDLADDLNI